MGAEGPPRPVADAGGGGVGPLPGMPRAAEGGQADNPHCWRGGAGASAGEGGTRFADVVLPVPAGIGLGCQRIVGLFSATGPAVESEVGVPRKLRQAKARVARLKPVVETFLATGDLEPARRLNMFLAWELDGKEGRQAWAAWQRGDQALAVEILAGLHGGCDFIFAD